MIQIGLDQSGEQDHYQESNFDQWAGEQNEMEERVLVLRGHVDGEAEAKYSVVLILWLYLLADFDPHKIACQHGVHEQHLCSRVCESYYTIDLDSLDFE